MKATSFIFIVLSSTRIRTHASRPIVRTAKRHYICSTPKEIRKLKKKANLIWMTLFEIFGKHNQYFLFVFQILADIAKNSDNMTVCLH